MTSPTDSVPISEKVRFWEEQDKINLELIPRVIRQHELLTEHIAEHETLPAVVANAVQHAVARARDEQQQQYEAALESAKAEFDERTESQKQLYETALNAAKTEFADQSSEQQRQYDKSLEAGVIELNRQMQETLVREGRRMRNLSTGIAAVSGAVIVVAAAMVSLIVG